MSRWLCLSECVKSWSESSLSKWNILSCWQHYLYPVYCWKILSVHYVSESIQLKVAKISVRNAASLYFLAPECACESGNAYLAALECPPPPWIIFLVLLSNETRLYDSSLGEIHQNQPALSPTKIPTRSLYMGSKFISNRKAMGCNGRWINNRRMI